MIPIFAAVHSVPQKCVKLYPLYYESESRFTYACITTDQSGIYRYHVIDPLARTYGTVEGLSVEPVSDDLFAVFVALSMYSIVPDVEYYKKAIRDAARALYGLNSSHVIKEVERLWSRIVYVLDRWSGRAGFEGLGVLEPLLRDPNLTEVVIAYNPLMKPEVIDEVPKGPKDVVQKVVTSVLQFNRALPVVVVRDAARLPTNLIIAYTFAPLLVRKAVPHLTLRNPFGTKEIVRHGAARVAADLYGYNMNIRKQIGTPLVRKVPFLYREELGKRLYEESVGAIPIRDSLDVLGLAAYYLFYRLSTVVISGAMGSGKTYMMNALFYLTPPWVQVVVVERGAREFLIPLENQMLYINVVHSDKLLSALDQALRYGTMKTVISLAEARTPDELKMLVMYKLTGHGGITTMHAERVIDAVQRIVDSGAPLEALHGTMVVQLHADPARGRYVSDLKMLIWSKDLYCSEKYKELCILDPRLFVPPEDLHVVAFLQDMARKLSEVSDPYYARYFAIEMYRPQFIAIQESDFIKRLP